MTPPSSWSPTNFGSPPTAAAVIGAGALLDFNNYPAHDGVDLHLRQGSAPSELDIVGINEHGLACLQTILTRYMPGGRVNGTEYVCGSLQGGPGDSCSTNLRSCTGREFNAGGKGWNDPISLVAAVTGQRQGEAAKELAAFLCIDPYKPGPAPPRREDQAVESTEQKRARARKMWAEGVTVSSHPYTDRKQVPVHQALRVHLPDNLLMVPFYDEHGVLQAIQRISPDGKSKKALGQFSGRYFVFEGDTSRIYIAEGYATAASVALTTGHMVVMAISTSNLLPVAEKLCKLYPGSSIVFAADNDPKSDGSNPGVEAAVAASQKIGKGEILYPPAINGGKADWNDFYVQFGADLTKERLLSHLPAQKIPLFDLSRLRTSVEIRTSEHDIEYVLDKLFPKRAIILNYGVGGCGKTTFLHQAGHAINDGMPFMGLQTKKHPVVFIDPENPMGVLKQGLSRIKGGDGVYYWTTTDDPPQLDGPEWEQLKSLVVTLRDPVLIIDTLQAATSNLDITSNADYSPVMARLKQLRELGATIILLHHTPKNDATTYVGASVIYNQVDHVLAMYAVRSPGEDREALKDDNADLVYRFGTKGKTRYGHHAIYVKFDKATCLFKEAVSPESEGLKVILAAMIDLHATTSVDLKALLAALKDSGCLLDTSEHHIRKLLKKGEGTYWETTKGLYNKTLYIPVPNSLNGTQSEKQAQPSETTEFNSFTATPSQTVKPHEQGLEQIGQTSDQILAFLGSDSDRFNGNTAEP